MYTHVFKEVKPEDIDVTGYFDGDCFTENCGNYCYTMFVLCDDYRGYTYQVYGLNEEEYRTVFNNIKNLFHYFGYHAKDYSYKAAMEENYIEYNPTKCSKLKKLYLENDYTFNMASYDVVAKYLSIVTGKTWTTTKVYGYCQGDIATVLYCEEFYTEQDAKITGEIYNGWCKEFCLVDLDENGQEQEETEVYGYYVADCQAYPEEDIKTVLCNYEGLKPEETKVLLIDYSTMHTYTKYEYEFTEI